MRYLRMCTIFLCIVLCITSGWTLYQNWSADKTPPVIKDSIGDLAISVADSENALLQGLTAIDNLDGDLTDKLIVERISRFVEGGMVMVDYVVFDKAGNLGRYSRSILYEDYDIPRLTLEKPLVYHVGDDISIMDRLKLSDCFGGDITHKLKIQSSNVNEYQVGQYEFVASAITDMGDEVSVRLPVNVISYDSNAPVIKLSEYLVYTKAGDSFKPQDYITEIRDKDGFPIPISEVFIFPQVDLSRPGSGQYRMEVIDGQGIKGYVFLSVIVTE